MRKIFGAIAVCGTLSGNPAQGNIGNIDAEILGESNLYGYNAPIQDTQTTVQQQFLDIISDYCADTHGLQPQGQGYHYYPEPSFSYHILPKRVEICGIGVQDRLGVVPLGITECGVRNDNGEIICTLRDTHGENPVCIPEPRSGNTTFGFGDCRETFTPN